MNLGKIDRFRRPAIQLVLITLAVASTITPNVLLALVFVAAFFAVAIHLDTKRQDDLEARVGVIESKQRKMEEGL